MIRNILNIKFIQVAALCLVLQAVLLENYVLAGNHVPSPPVSPFIEAEGNVRILYKLNPFNFLGEFKQRIEGDDFNFRYRSLTLGTYYRIMKNLKIGAFYRFQQGARHDNDWIEDATDWVWASTETRSEHLALFDITPRVKLDFMPGKNWVFELKSRYSYNTYNSHHLLRIRPGLTYFWIDGLDPFMNFYLQYEVYIPLNYSTKVFYERWLYLGSLYHFNQIVKFGIFGSYREITWTNSAGFDKVYPGSEYEKTFRSIMLGINFVFVL